MPRRRDPCFYAFILEIDTRVSVTEPVNLEKTLRIMPPIKL